MMAVRIAASCSACSQAGGVGGFPRDQHAAAAPFRIHAHGRHHGMVAKHPPVDVEDQQLYFLEAAVP